MGLKSWAFLTCALPLLFFGCSDARKVEALPSVSQIQKCSVCHGSKTSAAPPNDTAARTSTAEITVGAHQAHLNATLSTPLTCGNCHIVPTSVMQPGHIMGAPARVIFNASSSADGVAASWNRASATCTTYCHGASLAGGSQQQPVWTRVDGSQKTCGSCHGFPPPAPHPASTACYLCHGEVVDSAQNIIHREKHIDGSISAVSDSPTKACTECHTGKVIGTATKSKHPTNTSDPVVVREGCLGCHELSTHMSGGNIRILLGSGTVTAVNPADAAQIDSVCRSCHVATGRAILGRVPPTIPGYTSPTGDFHGTRAGTGFGGTLKAPYVRGQGPLPCSACHASHSSENGDLFASTVNGNPIASGAISRLGVGAEALCTSCHEGAYHAQCISCHGFDPQPPGSSCFVCHRHTGIVNYPYPTGNHSNYTGDCTHCHSAPWLPTARPAPAIYANTLVVRTITATSAKILWRTDQTTSSYVDYGPGSPALRAGSAALVADHDVSLSGLSPDTVYTFRVRSENNVRGYVESALGSFRTARADGPAAPILIDTADQWYESSPGPMTLAWNPVTIASGNPVQYRLVISLNANFSTLTIDTGWTTSTSYIHTFSDGTYYWRVMARDSVNTAHESPWSDPDTFLVEWAEPW